MQLTYRYKGKTWFPASTAIVLLYKLASGHGQQRREQGYCKID